jgi:tRNA A37 threonylcarbamoyladenosine synthetase subunit TsaC/SUA5/YrdC
MKTVLAPKKSEKTKIQKLAFEIVEKLREGGVVVIAIESAYVAIADPACDDGVAAFRSLKDLDVDISFPVFVNEINDLLSYLPEISDRDRLLTSAFWPGLLNVEFKSNEVLPCNLGSDSTPASVMARKPSNPLLNVVSELMGPVIYRALQDKNGKVLKSLAALIPANKKLVAIAINSGVIKSTKQTSIVSCVESRPRMVREGSIPAFEIKKVIPSLQAI